MHTAVRSASQVPDDPGVNVAKEHFAFFGSGAHALDIIEDPFDLGSGEIGCQGESYVFTEAILAAVPSKFVADSIGASILPDDGIIDGFAGCLFPGDHGLALVCNADCCNIPGVDTALPQRAFNHFLSTLPDSHGIMFDPAGLWVDLFVFLLIDPH